MKKITSVLAVVLLTTAVALAGPEASNERWLHVKIEKSGEKAEFVRVNIPLALAEKVLPAVEAGPLREGRIRIEGTVEGVELRAIFEAVRALKDGEFVTIETENETVRVAKEKGYLIARIHEATGSRDQIDVRVPMVIVEALVSGPGPELNLTAAIRALSEHGDEVLVNIASQDETVRVWVDSKSTME
ncbi:MAG: hypothetical protein HYY26_04070 [Acidobacteria bacterium]|nr:hypothetical protein [Acidobacteriota bacterium]